jgi:hypothetical protein
LLGGFLFYNKRPHLILIQSIKKPSLFIETVFSVLR